MEENQWRHHHCKNASFAVLIWISEIGENPRVPNEGNTGDENKFQSHSQQLQIQQLLRCGQVRYPEERAYLFCAFLFVYIYIYIYIYIIYINRGYLLFFEMNTKNISSSVLKTSEFSRVRSTSENSDVFNTQDDIFLVFIEKKVNFIFIFLYVTLAMYCNWTAARNCGLYPIYYSAYDDRMTKAKK